MDKQKTTDSTESETSDRDAQQITTTLCDWNNNVDEYDAHCTKMESKMQRDKAYMLNVAHFCSTRFFILLPDDIKELLCVNYLYKSVYKYFDILRTTKQMYKSLLFHENGAARSNKNKFMLTINPRWKEKLG